MHEHVVPIDVPEYVQEIAQTLLRNDFLVYLVGGSLRDTIMRRPVQDYDLATSAHPEQVVSLFSKTIEVGKQFGTVIIVHDGHTVETTTLRTEAGYVDFRHPEEVVFCDDIYQDLQRRDFTINAMAYDLQKNLLIDPYKGLDDIQKQVIRCVGNPSERLREDTLRIFRAARFVSQLGFIVDPGTAGAIRTMAPEVPLPACERIRIELIKLFDGPAFRRGLAYLYAWGVMQRLFPEGPTVPESRITDIPEAFDTYQRIAFYLGCLATDQSENFLTLLRFSRHERKLIAGLIENNYDYYLSGLTVKDLALSGADIGRLGFAGPEIGAVQRSLLSKVKSGTVANTREGLLREIDCSRADT